MINGQADRLQRLVDNLLNLARIEAGVVNVSKQQPSLNELLEEALHVVQPSAEAKQIELVARAEPAVPGRAGRPRHAAAGGDQPAVQRHQVHAAAAARSRSAAAWPTTRCASRCRTRASGLSEEDCQRVFEKFYRVKKDKDMASGTGLGLPLAKHIVEDVHGGRLTVESVLGPRQHVHRHAARAGQMRRSGRATEDHDDPSCIG